MAGIGVDAGRRGGPRGGDNREGRDPGGDVLVNRLAQRNRVHAETLVDRDPAQAVPADAKDDAGLLDG